jgi:uncharacterized membrane protein (DUF485 family)
MSFKTPIQRFFNPVFLIASFSLVGFLAIGIILLFIVLRFVIPLLIGFGVWWILDSSGSSYAVEIGILSAILVFIAGLITTAKGKVD